MNVNRNVLKIVAAALLMVSLPAGAQVLGGSVGGAANGALGGSLGRGGMHGEAAASGNAGIHATAAVHGARDRAQRTTGRTRDTASSTVGKTRSRVDSTRGTATATAQTAYTVGAEAGRRGASSALQTGTAVQHSNEAQASVPPRGGVLLDGSGSASTEQHAFGHTTSADAATHWEASTSRSSLSSAASSEASASVTKDEPSAQ